jgi:peptide/nickel transport system permease protein
MGRYVLKRLVQMAITLAIVVVAIFFVFQVLGDPARGALPLNATEQQVEEYRQATGLADPIEIRLVRYLKDAVRLDFGESTSRGGPAIAAAVEALPRSFALAGAASIVMVVVSLVAGVAAGLDKGGRVDRAVQTCAAVAAAIPEFWSGLMLIIVFAVGLRWFPTGGYGGLQFIVLPAIAMAIPPIGRLAFVVRESVRGVLREPFMIVARAKGLSAGTLVMRHILRAALIPIISVGGLELTRMAIGGVMVIEAVFSWPGLGRLYIEAMRRFDLPLVSATLFCATLAVLAMNLILDIVYVLIDPRVDLAKA